MSRHTRPILTGLILGAALLTAGETRVSACSCIGPLASCESVSTTDAVFVGRVTELGPAVRGTREEPFPQRRVALEVHEPFKGLDATARTAELFTGMGGGDCGYPFVVGSTYLVFAHQWNGRLTASICSNTLPIEKAATDLAYLRGPFRDSASTGIVRGVATRMDPTIDGQPTPRTPVVGARIRLEGYSHITETFTGTDGAYEFRVPPGDYNLFAGAGPGRYSVPGWDDGHALTLGDARACAVRDVMVRSDGRVTGRLLDANGRAVPLLTLELAKTTDPDSRRLSAHARARTNERGYFEFARLEPGRYLLGLLLERDQGMPEADYAIWVRRRGSDRLVAVELEPEVPVDIDIVQLPPVVATVPVSGIVVDVNGAPVRDASVWVGVEPRVGVGSQPFVTGDDGQFRFNVVAERRYRLYAEQPVTVGDRRQFRVAKNEPFEAVGRLKPFRLVLSEVR